MGAGPNGLTAAVTLARAGLSVQVYEAETTVGGGARTEELTLPGFWHDPCSAVHPLAAASPAFETMPLAEHGLEWVHPARPLAHPLLDGSVAVLDRSPQVTALGLGKDGYGYRRLVLPFVDHFRRFVPDVLSAPLDGVPRSPLRYARFGVEAAQPVSLLARRFRTEPGRVLLAGLAAHSVAPLNTPVTGGVALLFALAAHAVGWPFPRGGSRAISNALASYLATLGGTVYLDRRIQTLAELPRARAYLLDVSPDGLLALAGYRLPLRRVRSLRRYRYGPAAFKIDYALAGPVPWTSPEASRAGTVHLGANYHEISVALNAAMAGRDPQTPFLITAQPSLFDPTRAPAGKHVFWAYAHVPYAWPGDATEAMERQIERFAPGFRDLVLARNVAGPAELQRRNANYVGGDIACGAFTGLQTLFRPTLSAVPYATGDPSVFLCSSATPPGPGVHGMCGHRAARAALRRVFGITAAADCG